MIIRKAESKDIESLRGTYNTIRVDEFPWEEKHPEKPLTLKCVVENQRASQFYLHHGWTVLEVVDDVVPYYRMIWSR
ncbi:MAG: hypothetical protein Q4B03_06015 [Lachnospiraceae bacterium]|nr:hypothetical protein [Lachnospiraceae bacterium]